MAKFTEQKPTLGRHTEGSDYGTDAYTLWPNGAILQGLTPNQAKVIRRALVADWRARKIKANA